MNDRELAALLAPAGLELIERVGGDVRRPASAVGHSAATIRPGLGSGRFDSTKVDLHEPDMADKINAAWYRMAVTHGLFAADREFYLSAGCWLRVRLLDKWDFVRSEVRQLGGCWSDSRYFPEFTAVSLDGRVLLETTMWGDGTVSIIAIRP